MPTNKELLEADAFHRRRVVRSFLRGTTDGPSPPRRGRAVTIGSLLSALLAAGVLVAGLLGLDVASVGVR
jgi:hypothetical protein